MRSRNLGRAVQGATKRLDGRSNDIDFLGAQIAALASVRVETGHGDARVSDASADEEVREKLSNSHDFRRRQESGNVNQRNMRRDERDSDLAAGQAHGEIVDSAAFGEKFGLAGKGKARVVHRSFWKPDP